jgi:hypothetical protein
MKKQDRRDMNTNARYRKMVTSELAYDASHRNYANSTSAISRGTQPTLWSGRTDLGRIGKPVQKATREQQVVVTDVEAITESIRKEFRKFTL